MVAFALVRIRKDLRQFLRLQGGGGCPGGSYEISPTAWVNRIRALGAGIDHLCFRFPIGRDCRELLEDQRSPLISGARMPTTLAPRSTDSAVILLVAVPRITFVASMPMTSPAICP